MGTYPTTRFLEKAVAREYAIGMKWLATNENSGKPEDRLPQSARYTGGLPMLDVGGSALAVLEHVRQHDPTGPLADDALMKIAEHHYNLQDYETASEYYDQLIANDPKSPFLQQAQMATIEEGQDARLPRPRIRRDSASRRRSRRSARPRPPSRAARPAPATSFYHKLDLIADQKAERAFSVASYYKSAGAIDSAEYYSGMVPKRWPKSPWAEKAKTEAGRQFCPRPRLPVDHPQPHRP